MPLREFGGELDRSARGCDRFRIERLELVGARIFASNGGQRPRARRVGQGKTRILGNRRFEMGQRRTIGRFIPGEVEQRPALKKILVSVDVFRAARRGLVRRDLHRHGLRNQPGDFGLHRENIGELPVDALRPAREPRPPVGQVYSDPDRVRVTLHRSGQQVTHAQAGGDRLDVARMLIGLFGGGAGQHPQRSNAGEGASDLLGQSIGEIILRGIAVDVAEWKHCDAERSSASKEPSAFGNEPGSTGRSNRSGRCRAANQHSAPRDRRLRG
jgi:hypothetical protein